MAVDDKMLRYNEQKPQMSLVPGALKRAASRALGYGCVKYKRDDWRKGGSWNAVIDSLQRHVDAFTEGEDRDKESGLLHTDHIAANLAFLCEFIEQNTPTDDRWKRPAIEPVEKEAPLHAVK